jgi:alcohol dehydrogenase class IV
MAELALPLALAPFEIALPTRILFGAGKVAEVAPALATMAAGPVLVVTGRDASRAEALCSAIEARGQALATVSIAGEPTLDDVRRATALARAQGSTAVVAMGGGSVIDAGKAVAALLGNGGDPLDYLEVIGRGRALERPSLPFVAVPTTAGTGAEVTRNAVLSSPEQKVKASLRSPHMLPRLAVIDPDLLASAPRAVLCASGLDALSQLIEPFVSSKRNPFSDALAREGLLRSTRSLRRAVLEGADAGAREDLALASLFGGLCLANAGLGAVHGFAAPLGGMFEAPHGAVCAALLPHVLEANVRAARAANDQAPLLARLDELGPLLTGLAHARADDAVLYVRKLCLELSVPRLSAYGMRESDVPTLVERAKQASSMKGNPLVLSDAALRTIALSAL